MKILDLFSGIGGFTLAASWCWGDELDIAGFCENDKYCQKVLKKHWPNVPIHNDIKDIDAKKIKSIDLITAGVPCQPASNAGKQKGTKDDRWLWPEAFRIIRDTKPKWVILENVFGLLNLEGGLVFENLLSELEALHYETQTFIIPACAVDAPHRRNRVWIVGHSECESRWKQSKRRLGMEQDTFQDSKRQESSDGIASSRSVQASFTTRISITFHPFFSNILQTFAASNLSSSLHLGRQLLTNLIIQFSLLVQAVLSSISRYLSRIK